MMRKSFAVMFILFLVAGVAYAQERGTAAEAKSLLDYAVAYYKANGQEKAFEAFNDPRGKFTNKDLYIFAVDMKGKMIAHGADAGLIGKDMIDSRDADGKPFIKEMVDTAAAKGKGVVYYKWLRPDFRYGYRPEYNIGREEPKATFFEKVGNVVLCSGYYTLKQPGESM